jgi:hypothetical protein
MRARWFSALVVAFAALWLALPASAEAAGARSGHHSVATNWTQYDTSTYVLSTLNLVDPLGSGRPDAFWKDELHAARFDVYADPSQPGLYFIEARRDDGSVAAAFAYKMGWSVPRLLDPIAPTPPVAHLARAPRAVSEEFHADHRVLLGSFDSTFAGT